MKANSDSYSATTFVRYSRGVATKKQKGVSESGIIVVEVCCYQVKDWIVAVNMREKF